jgi:hypothetical protein
MRGFPVFRAKILQRAIARKEKGFLGHSVKHLFIDYAANASEISDILAACTGVTNLFAQFMPDPHIQALSDLQRVQYLAIDVEALLLSATIDLTQSLFRDITHLKLLDMNHCVQTPL